MDDVEQIVAWSSRMLKSQPRQRRTAELSGIFRSLYVHVRCVISFEGWATDLAALHDFTFGSDTFR